MSSRPTAERVAAARQRLATEENVWLATSSADGDPHLVPLSLAWLDERIVVATPATTPTARNAVATGRGRAALDGADDVVLFDVRIEVLDYPDADASLRGRFVDRVGWDPADEPGEWALLILHLERGQAWIGPGEIRDRAIVRDGTWLES